MLEKACNVGTLTLPRWNESLRNIHGTDHRISADLTMGYHLLDRPGDSNRPRAVFGAEIKRDKKMKMWPGQTDGLNPPLMSPKDKGNFWLALSIGNFGLAISSYFSPPTTPATGRWAWIHKISSGFFGASGEVILFLVLACACLLGTVLNYRESKIASRR